MKRRIVVVAVALTLAACATAGPQKTEISSAATNVAPSAPREATPEGPTVACDVVCDDAVVVPRPADGPDHHAAATEDANRVLSSMHDELLACYARRVKAAPTAHAFLTVDIVIGPDGKVRDVVTTGGALLGQEAMRCLEQTFRKGTFAAPHGGGTLRIQVPFSLRRLAPGEDV